MPKNITQVIGNGEYMKSNPGRMQAVIILPRDQQAGPRLIAGVILVQNITMTGTKTSLFILLTEMSNLIQFMLIHSARLPLQIFRTKLLSVMRIRNPV